MLTKKLCQAPLGPAENIFLGPVPVVHLQDRSQVPISGCSAGSQQRRPTYVCAIFQVLDKPPVVPLPKLCHQDQLMAMNCVCKCKLLPDNMLGQSGIC